MPVPVLWIIAIIVFGLTGSAAAYFLTQAANSLILLAIVGVVIVFCLYPIAPPLLKKLRAHAERVLTETKKEDTSKGVEAPKKVEAEAEQKDDKKE